MKRLSDLVDQGQPVPIRGIAVDSRAVKPGDLFVAIRGVHHDGHDHVESVVRAGAAAILAERPVTAPVPVHLVPSTSAALSGVAARFLIFRLGPWTSSA